MPRSASQTVTTCPPARSTRFNLPGEKNPISRESGDQNGKLASDVSATGRAAAESSERTQMPGSPPAFEAVKATVRPSGDNAISARYIFSGNGSVARIGGV